MNDKFSSIYMSKLLDILIFNHFLHKSLKVIKAILGLLIRAIIQKRKGKTLRQAVKKAILVRSLSGGNLLKKLKSKSPARVHPQQNVEKKLPGDDPMT